MPSVKVSTMQAQSAPVTQKEAPEQKRKPVESAANVDSGAVFTPKDVVTLSTEKLLQSDTKPSVPVSHAEMKALYKAFSIRV